MKVYLAGGMKTEWRETVKAAMEAEWLDPTCHGLEDAAAYTAWDLAAIRECDVVLAMFESSNPVGYNMAFELGVAHALGKPVIFVNERFADEVRPVSMLVQTFPTVSTLEAGIDLLRRGRRRLDGRWTVAAQIEGSPANRTCRHGRHFGGYYCEDCEDETQGSP